ncbi:MAG: hypothetical protein ABIS69_06815 [Sediminibacterium sp.]
MKKLPLLPHSCQRIGFILFVPFLVLGCLYTFWGYEIPWLTTTQLSNTLNNDNLTDELAAIGIIISLMLIAFSKEKIEDEAIQFFRLASLQWAVILNYIVLIICVVAIYGSAFFAIMMYNMFTILLFFVIRFRFVLFMHKKASV